MLTVRELCVDFGPVSVLRGVSLAAASGEVVGVIGPNGAGKSTLVNTLAGVNRVSRGDVHLGGELLEARNSATAVSRGLVLIPQGRRLFNTMTVHENLVMGAYSARDRRVTSERLRLVLDRFPELKDWLPRKAANLSGGQQQLVCVARGVMAGAKVMMLDEPSLGVAPIVIERIGEVIRQLAEDIGVAVVLVEQNMDLLYACADRVVVLVQGRDVHTGQAEAIRADPTLLPELYFGASVERDVALSDVTTNTGTPA